MTIPDYLDDEQAERIGAKIAKDFGLRCQYPTKGFYTRGAYDNSWITGSGTFTNKGIARRAMRMIKENL